MADDEQHPVLLEVLDLKAHHLPDIPQTRFRAVAKLDGPLREPYDTDDSSSDPRNPTWETPFTVALRRCSLDSRLRVSIFFAKRSSRTLEFIGSALFPLRSFAGPHGAEMNGALESKGSGIDSSLPPPTLTIRAFLIGRSGSCYAARFGAKVGQASGPTMSGTDAPTNETSEILSTSEDGDVDARC